MTRFRSAAWMVTPWALAVVLAACGGSAPAAPSSTVSASVAASTAAKPSTASSGAVQASAAASAKPSEGTAASSAAKPAASSGVTIKAAYVPVIAFAALYRAMDKGYFTAEGINMDLTVVQSASNAIAFLGSGQLDAAYGNIGDSFFNAVNRNVNVRIIAGLTYSPHDPKLPTSAPLVVRKQLLDSQTVKGPADLKGRKVALNTNGGIQEYLLAHALQPVNLSVKDVDTVIMGFPDLPAALKNGAIDAAQPPEPFLTNSLEGGFASMLVANPAPDSLITALLYGGNLLAPDKEPVAKSILNALRRASNELQTKEQILSDENVAIWSKWVKIPEADIRKEVLNVYAQNLILDVNSMMDQQQYLVQAGRVEYKQALPESSLIDPRFVTRK